MFYIKSLLQEHWSLSKENEKSYISIEDKDGVNTHFKFAKDSFHTYGKVQFLFQHNMIYESECELDFFWDSLADKTSILSGAEVKIDNSYFIINIQNMQSKYFKLAIAEYKQLPKKIYEIPYNDFIKGIVASSNEYFSCLLKYNETRKETYQAQRNYFKEWENDLRYNGF